MLDSMSFGELPLNSYDEPLKNSVIATEDSLCDNSVSGTGYFAVNRHFGSINAVFLDFSARQVALKQLWRLRWHRKYDTTEEYPEWPDWMIGFPVD